jgi:RND family efflux transporter MFP subunit
MNPKAFDFFVSRRPAPAPALLAVACALAVGGGVWLGHAQAQQPAAPATTPKAAMTVTVQHPQAVAWPTGLSANGAIAPWQEVSVAAQGSGLRLLELRAQVGDRVAADQVLALMDAEPVRAELAQARAGLAEAQAAAAEAQSNAERARSLQGTGALSEQQMTQLTTAAVAAQARVASAQAQVALQELRLKHTEVRAPDAGVVAQRPATLGAVVPAGTELFRLIRQGRLEWRAELPSADVSQVRTGQAAVVRLPGGAEVSGRVRLVAPTVDAQTRNALVHVDLTPGERALAARAGMFASGTLQTGERKGWAVPQQAVVQRDGFAYVYVLAEGDKVQRLKVQTGRRQGERVEVTEGLGAQPAQARVVVAGAGFLNDGDKVKVVAP